MVEAARICVTKDDPVSEAWMSPPGVVGWRKGDNQEKMFNLPHHFCVASVIWHGSFMEPGLDQLARERERRIKGGDSGNSAVGSAGSRRRWTGWWRLGNFLKDALRRQGSGAGIQGVR